MNHGGLYFEVQFQDDSEEKRLHFPSHIKYSTYRKTLSTHRSQLSHSRATASFWESRLQPCHPNCLVYFSRSSSFVTKSLFSSSSLWWLTSWTGDTRVSGITRFFGDGSTDENIPGSFLETEKYIRLLFEIYELIKDVSCAAAGATWDEWMNNQNNNPQDYSDVSQLHTHNLKHIRGCVCVGHRGG